MAKKKKQAKKQVKRATNGAGLPGIVCENIRGLRAKRKLTLAAFAEKTKFTASYISTMEHAHRTPTLETLERVAKAFNIPVDKFLRKGAVH